MTNRLIVCVVLCCLAGFAQGPVSSTSGQGLFRGESHFSGLPPFIKPVTGAPCSGERVTETVQTLADGTHITRTGPSTKVYRDSFGRTREERPMFGGAGPQAPNASERPVIIEITDPVAQVRYTLDTQGKVAHRQGLSAPEHLPARRVGGGGGAPLAVSGRMRPVDPAAQATEAKGPERSTEKLDPQIIQGVLAEGTRHTTTWPVGSMGNDRPITSVSESWQSPELQVSLLIKTTDPRTGEHTERLTQISRSEPDPSLFQPPSDYTVVDEKEDFTIKWGSGLQ
jgi:hypothetical protein